MEPDKIDYQQGGRPRNSDPDGDEFNVIQLFLILWKRRYWIVAGTVLATVLGTAKALLSPPVFDAQSTIALKESEKGGDATSMLSRLGGMGGLVASQLGMGSTNLDKIEIILRGHELAETVIERNNLLPLLFPALWNAEDSAWVTRDHSEVPTLRKGIDILRNRILSVSTDPKKNVIRFGIKIHDPMLAKRMVEMYLVELNNKIRRDVIMDAELNREYLEKQLNHTTDPILVEKIRNMIAFEIEKVMLVSSNTVQVLEKPVVPLERSAPKRKKMVIMSFVVGVFASVMAAFAWNAAANLRLAVSQNAPSQKRKL